MEKIEMENVEYLGKTASEWAVIEAEEHDQENKDAFPFGLKTYEFSKERAWWYEDYAYKKGRRKDRGHRTKKVFELIDFKNLKSFRYRTWHRSLCRTLCNVWGQCYRC